MTIRPSSFVRRHAYLLLVAGVACMVAAGFFVYRDTFGMEPSDQREYWKLSVRVYEGAGFYDDYWHAHRPPGYPYLLAGFFHLVGGPNRDAVRLIQATSWVATCLIIAMLGTDLVNRSVGASSGFVFALQPALPWFAMFTLYEVWFVLLVAMLMLALCQWRKTSSAIWAVAIGSLAGAMSLTHGKALMLVPFLALYMVFSKRHHGIRDSGLVLLLVGIILLPWMIRNYRVLGGFVPVNTSGGRIIYQAYNPHDPALLDRSQPELLNELARAAGGDELLESRLGYHRALEWITGHPLDALELMGRKLLLFLNPFIEPKLILAIIYLGMEVFALGGIWLLLRAKRYDALGLLAIPILWTAACNVGFLVFYRYRFPMYPALAILCGVALGELWGWATRSWNPAQRLRLGLPGR